MAANRSAQPCGLNPANDNLGPSEAADVAEDRWACFQAVVTELRARLLPLTAEQWQWVGIYMLKALWLGEGKSTNEVLQLKIYDEKEN